MITLTILLKNQLINQAAGCLFVDMHLKPFFFNNSKTHLNATNLSRCEFHILCPHTNHTKCKADLRLPDVNHTKCKIDLRICPIRITAKSELIYFLELQNLVQETHQRYHTIGVVVL